MIKLIIFDLDGVLIDSKKIHFNSLNIALEYAGYPPISYTEHLKKLDGLPTLKKLNLLLSCEDIRGYRSHAAIARRTADIIYNHNHSYMHT